MNWNVKASPHFWRTALPLKEKNPHEQLASIIRSKKDPKKAATEEKKTDSEESNN